MKCLRCESTHTRKNGRQRGKQNYICVDCKRQFIEYYDHKGYREDIKIECLEMYVNGSGFRAIERVKKVHHTTVLNWVRQLGCLIRLVIHYLKHGSMALWSLCVRKLEVIA